MSEEKEATLESKIREFREGEDKRPEARALLSNIKAHMNELKELLTKVDSEWHSEDKIYRFYHQSFKVYWIQSDTGEMVQLIKKIGGENHLNEWFEQIVEEGTKKNFEWEHNHRWLEETRPMIEAFFHARYFIQMMVKYGEELEYAPRMLPSGWASILYLYNMR